MSHILQYFMRNKGTLLIKHVSVNMGLIVPSLCTKSFIPSLFYSENMSKHTDQLRSPLWEGTQDLSKLLHLPIQQFTFLQPFWPSCLSANIGNLYLTFFSTWDSQITNSNPSYLCWSLSSIRLSWDPTTLFKTAT